MKEFIIKRVLAWLAGVTAKQWAAALLWVLNTARQYRDDSGATKRERVVSVLKKQFPEMDGGDILTLVQNAWAWLNKTGKLP